MCPARNQGSTKTVPRFYGETYGRNAAEIYERSFVPAIGAPMAADLVETAALRRGERVLDVACGTGVVTRLAAERVGSGGRVAGVDVNPSMLAVARTVAPSGTPIEWYEASADAMPLPDESFDVVLCQMSLQFFPDQPAALREMRRVLVPGGRLALNTPGPIAPAFAAFEAALARHVGPPVAGFLRQVFSLHDTGALRGLLSEAGFRDVDVRSHRKTLRLGAPRDFLWQYVHGTPLGEAIAETDEATRAALERDVLAEWERFVEDGAVVYPQGFAVATAVR